VRRGCRKGKHHPYGHDSKRDDGAMTHGGVSLCLATLVCCSLPYVAAERPHGIASELKAALDQVADVCRTRPPAAGSPVTGDFGG
jgi:hypothetical protein